MSSVKSVILKLAPELRVMIYEYAFTINIEPLDSLFVAEPELDLLTAKDTMPAYDLLATCRKIHDEAKPSFDRATKRYWDESTFYLGVSTNFWTDIYLSGLPKLLWNLPIKSLPEAKLRFYGIKYGAVTSDELPTVIVETCGTCGNHLVVSLENADGCQEYVIQILGELVRQFRKFNYYGSEVLASMRTSEGDITVFGALKLTYCLFETAKEARKLWDLARGTGIQAFRGVRFGTVTRNRS